MAPAQAGDRLVEVADDLSQQGALRRALLGQRVVFSLQHEPPRDQPLVRFRIVVVRHSHPGGEVAAERYDCREM